MGSESDPKCGHPCHEALRLAARYLGLRVSSKALASDNRTAHSQTTHETTQEAIVALGLEGAQVTPTLHLSDDALPALCKSDGAWHIIVESGPGGLAVALDGGGEHKPIRLSGKPSEVWALSKPSATSQQSLSVPVLAQESAKPLRAASLTRMLMPGAGVLTLVVLVTASVNLLALAIPLATMNIFDRVLTNNAYETLVVLTIGAGLALAFDFVLRNLRATLLDRACASTDIRVLGRLFDHLIEVRATAAPVGQRVNTLREYEGLREYFNASAVATLGDLPFLFVFLGVLWWIAGPLAIIPLVSGLALLCIIFVVQLRVRRLVGDTFAASASKNIIATELLAALPTLQLAGAQRWAGMRWERASGDQLRQSLKLRFWTSFSTHLLVIFQGATTLAVLAFGAYLVMGGELSPGALFAANLLSARCLAPLAGLAGLGSRFAQMRLVRDQIAELTMAGEVNESGTLQSPNNPQTLKALHINHRYSSEGPLVLQGADFTIQRGEWVAIIGGIGSGKSTLFDCLTGRIRPHEGSVRVDTLSLDALDMASWRGGLGIVPQAPSFFTGTLRDNVDLGRGFDDRAISRALSLAGADWANASGQGLDLPLGERGQGLSGGQLQTLALARALVGDPNWLLLDEPSAHLDGQTEARFMKALAARREHHTLIAVTHRPAVVESMDRLIVMDGGHIRLDGPRKQVLEQLRTLSNSAADQGDPKSGFVKSAASKSFVPKPPAKEAG